MSNIYEEKTVQKLMLTFSIPSIFALIIEILTSVIDTAFAGNIVDQGSNALAAMGLLSPLLAILTALQTLFAISTSIMIAKYTNDKESLNKNFIIGIIMTLVISILTSIFIFIFMNPILDLLGAKGSILNLAKQFLQIQLISNVFSSIGYTLASVIRAFGFPNIEFRIILFAVIINIFFNTILTFGFSLGLKGIALGTLISEVLGAFIAFSWLVRKKLWVTKIKFELKEFISIVKSIFIIGISQTIIQVLAGCTVTSSL
ncbi:MAG: MATE family efflux transporter [Terrisporobacter sp.]|uniref:MATE family efflux transporter n=1 Tax=Terrisporobacter sp. TaxID=1965305 RepID=UPI002FC6BD4E